MDDPVAEIKTLVSLLETLRDPLACRQRETGAKMLEIVKQLREYVVTNAVHDRGYAKEKLTELEMHILGIVNPRKRMGHDRQQHWSWADRALSDLPWGMFGEN